MLKAFEDRACDGTMYNVSVHAAPAVVCARMFATAAVLAQAGALAQHPDAAASPAMAPCSRRRCSPAPRRFRAGAPAAPTSLGSGPR
eukprot:6047067-Pyramimonas_sp.AAC.1